MKKIVRWIIRCLWWGAIAERRQAELNEEHMRTMGYYVDNNHNIINI